MDYRKIQEKFYEDQYLVDKYFCSGIYAIYMTFPDKESSEGHQRKLLYVGKSKNMLQRAAAHYTHMKYPYCDESFQHKYEIIRLLVECGFHIQFDVLEYTSSIGEAEAKWIAQLKPPLNYQIPKPDGSGWTINPKAKSITVREILGL